MKSHEQAGHVDKEIVRLALVGDALVGKSNLLLSYATDQFNIDYTPTVFEHFTSEIEVHGQPCQLELWDLSANDDHKSLRNFAYSKSDAILICFSLTDQSSWQSVTQKWLPELRQNEKTKGLPMILVGTKSDCFLNDEFGDEEEEEQEVQPMNRVSEEEARQFVEREGLSQYFETSALMGDFVKPVFDCAIELMVRNSQAKKQERSTEMKGKKEKDKNKDKGCVLF